MIFGYSSAERPYSEASTTFQSGYFCEINHIIQVGSSGRKNAAELLHIV